VSRKKIQGSKRKPGSTERGEGDSKQDLIEVTGDL